MSQTRKSSLPHTAQAAMLSVPKGLILDCTSILASGYSVDCTAMGKPFFKIGARLCPRMRSLFRLILQGRFVRVRADSTSAALKS